MTRCLSKTFASDGKIQKHVIDDYPVGYIVSGGGRGGGAYVRPLYRADITINTKDEITVIASHEVGERLNGQYYEDGEGARLALIAHHAIAALEERARMRKIVAQEAETKKRRKKRQ